jgi:hypothetical protein
VRELDPNKKVLLLLNKADLITPASRCESFDHVRLGNTSGLLFEYQQLFVYWHNKVVLLCAQHLIRSL